jgi:hypothetical protein
MIEIALGLGICVSMGKIARGGQSVGDHLVFHHLRAVRGHKQIPLPFFRFLIAGAVAFAGMTGYKIFAKKV